MDEKAEGAAPEGRIDRQALSARYKITLTKPDALSPLSAGNGEFALTAAVTGLQTFPEFHILGNAIGDDGAVGTQQCWALWVSSRRLPS